MLKLLTLILALAAAAYPQDPKTEPLVQAKDMAFVGSFALPQETKGTSRAGYGGQGITPYTDPVTGKKTIFIGGLRQSPGNVGQFEVPATLDMSFNYGKLPVAGWIQPFANAVDGDIKAKAGITTNDGGALYGLQVYHGRLVLSAVEYYGCSQTATHGYSSLDLSNASDFKGFYRVSAAAQVRAIGGPMAIVPQEWRASLGGPVIGGMFGTVALAGCTSAGPAITAFDPDSLGTTATKGTSLAYYTLDHPLCAGVNCKGSDTTSNIYYNWATRLGGMAFPSGTRSVLIIGRQGTGPFCYGLPSCAVAGDPAEDDGKGPHCWPYRYQVWAYDANDLAKVKTGTVKTYEVRPYAIWALPELDNWGSAGGAKIVAAGYDQDSKRIYITTDYGEKPRVDVYQVTTPVSVPPVDTILPPPVVVPPVDTAKACKPDTVRIKRDSLIYVPVRYDSLIYVPVKRDSLIYVPTPYPVPYPVVHVDTLYVVPKIFRVQAE